MRVAVLALLVATIGAADGVACVGAPVALLPHDAALDPPVLTIEARVRLDADDGPALRWIVAGNGDASAPGCVGLALAGDRIGACVAPVGGGPAVLAFASDQRLQVGRWHHVAMVFDGAALRVYLDAKPAAAAAVGRARARGDGAFALGAAPGGAGFRGALADVTLWSRALPRAEIAAHAAGEAASDADPGFVRRWNFAAR